MTNRLSQHHIVTLALYMVGGEGRFVDTEDVAIKAHELAPDQFCWRKHPDQINLELIRVCLSNAKKPENLLVSGSGTKGWTLTPDGLRWAKSKSDALLSGDVEIPKGAQRAGSVDSARKSRELSRITLCGAWEKWTDNTDGISVTDANQVFRIDSYSKGEMLRQKVERAQKMFIDDDDMSRFLKDMGEIVFSGE